jgi:hypothetical protein
MPLQGTLLPSPSTPSLLSDGQGKSAPLSSEPTGVTREHAMPEGSTAGISRRQWSPPHEQEVPCVRGLPLLSCCTGEEERYDKPSFLPRGRASRRATVAFKHALPFLQATRPPRAIVASVCLPQRRVASWTCPLN